MRLLDLSIMLIYHLSDDTIEIFGGEFQFAPQIKSLFEGAKSLIYSVDQGWVGM